MGEMIINELSGLKLVENDYPFNVSKGVGRGVVRLLGTSWSTRNHH
jgi:hypothetical protein